MSCTPIPPDMPSTRHPVAARFGTCGASAAEGHSAYAGMDKQQTVAAYLKRLRAIKMQSIACILADFVAVIWFVEAWNLVLYLLGLVAVFVIAVAGRVRMGMLFVDLNKVVSEDCDPARYRAVLDALAARDRFGRSVNTIAIERAYCDYLELDSALALRRLGSVSFKRKDDLRRFRAKQIELLSRVDLGDEDGARNALVQLSVLGQAFKAGTRNRVSADAQVEGYAVLLRPPAERSASDAARMREHMVEADCHQQRANWQLCLAEYELLHGSRDEAARLATDPALDPLTPRMERLRRDVLMELESGC